MEQESRVGQAGRTESGRSDAPSLAFAGRACSRSGQGSRAIHPNRRRDAHRGGTPSAAHAREAQPQALMAGLAAEPSAVAAQYADLSDRSALASTSIEARRPPRRHRV